MLSAGKELRVSVQPNKVQMLAQLSRPVAAEELFSPGSHGLFPHQKAAINHPPVTSLLRGDTQRWNRFPKGLSVSLATFLQGKGETVELLSKSLESLLIPAQHEVNLRIKAVAPDKFLCAKHQMRTPPAR